MASLETRPYSETHPWVVLVGDTMYTARGALPPGESEELGPVFSPKQHLMVLGDDSDPIQDSGKIAPVSKNPAPPAAPFPAKVAPKSSQPPGGAPHGQDSDDSDKPLKKDPMDTDGPGTNDNQYEEYVGGHITTEWAEAAAAKCPICGTPPVSSCACKGPHTMEMLAAGHGKTCANGHRWSGRLAYCMASQTVAEPRLDPKPLPNPDGGGLAPNPDNATYIPTGADSLDDGKEPPIEKLSWFIGSRKMARKIDPSTGLAKWPLDFATIERDFDRPNKVPDPGMEPNDPGGQDSRLIGDRDKPYETGSPPI